MRNQQVRYSLLLGGIGALLFIPFLGGVRLFDWDEINFAECSREMLVLRDYFRVHVDFIPFYEKPPFFFWLQATAMHLFGTDAFAARLPNALCGIITLVYLYNLGCKLHNHRFGVLWALAYLGSVTPHLYFRSGIIDPYFNLFIFIGLVNLIFASWKREGIAGVDLPKSIWMYVFLGGLILGTGVITKGPVAYLIVCLVLGVYWLLARFRWFITPVQFLAFSAATTIVSLCWYGLETYAHGPKFMAEFLTYNYRLFSTPDAGHGGFPGYHFVILLVGAFPASVFSIRGQGPMPGGTGAQRDFRRWMIILFWVVLILFSIVKSKIVHYSSMCYFPLTYLAALTLSRIETGQIRFGLWLKTGVIGIGAIYVLATIGAPILAQHIDVVKTVLAKDPFAVANMDAVVNWTYWQVIPGVLLLVVLVLSVLWFNQRQSKRAVVTLFGGMAVFITLTLWFFIGRIEAISQGAAMDFFEQTRGQDVYVKNIAYRSYGPFFYTQKPPVTNPNYYNERWLLRGPINKDVLFITKITETKSLDSLTDATRLGQKNGFVFYRRAKK